MICSSNCSPLYQQYYTAMNFYSNILTVHSSLTCFHKGYIDTFTACLTGIVTKLIGCQRCKGNTGHYSSGVLQLHSGDNYFRFSVSLDHFAIMEPRTRGSSMRGRVSCGVTHNCESASNCHFVHSFRAYTNCQWNCIQYRRNSADYMYNIIRIKTQLHTLIIYYSLSKHIEWRVICKGRPHHLASYQTNQRCSDTASYKLILQPLESNYKVALSALHYIYNTHILLNCKYNK